MTVTNLPLHIRRSYFQAGKRGGGGKILGGMGCIKPHSFDELRSLKAQGFCITHHVSMRYNLAMFCCQSGI
jgi:hypothetical protein